MTDRLSRDAILGAARAHVDEHGLGSLSTRVLAARLDVTPMAIYRHVQNMDEVTGAIVDDLLDGLGSPRSAPGWRAWLEASALALRRLLAEHPAALALFTRRPVTSPAARRRLEATTSVLRDAGFAPEEAVRAYAAVHTYTIGFCALEAARNRTPAPDAPLDAPDDDASIAIRGFVSDDQFAYGLRALVGGLSPRARQP